MTTIVIIIIGRDGKLVNLLELLEIVQVKHQCLQLITRHERADKLFQVTNLHFARTLRSHYNRIYTIKLLCEGAIEVLCSMTQDNVIASAMRKRGNADKGAGVDGDRLVIAARHDYLVAAVANFFHIDLQ